MRIVAKIPYQSITPEEIQEIDQAVRYNYSVGIVLDPKNQQMLVVVL
jgi:hypothetical protein